MSEPAAPVAVPVGATATGPATPAPAAPVATPEARSHHSTTQPREQGKFAGPPSGAPAAAPQQAPTPKAWKLGDVEITDPDELYAVAAERNVDYEAHAKALQRLQELEKQAQRWKDPYAALTPEQREQIALQQLREFQQREEEAKLPPEQRAFLQQRREFERQRAEFQRQQQEQQQQRVAEAERAEREGAVNALSATMKILGESMERPTVAMQLAIAEFKAAAVQGKQYPPEVIAKRVRDTLDRVAMERASRMQPARLLQNKALVDALNAVEDPALLAALAPLINRGRLLNLQQMGTTPQAAPKPTAAPVPTLQPGQQPRTTAEWQAYFRNGGQADTPERIRWRNDLRDRGLL